MLSEDEAQDRARLVQLGAEIQELMDLETPIWDAIDRVSDPGGDPRDWKRLQSLHDELELIGRQIRLKVAQRDALSDKLGIYRRRVAR